jgi:hypothetical protein
MREKTIKIVGCNFCWTPSSLLASVDVIEFQTAEAYSVLDVTNVKYIIHKQSREEYL